MSSSKRSKTLASQPPVNAQPLRRIRSRRGRSDNLDQTFDPLDATDPLSSSPSVSRPSASRLEPVAIPVNPVNVEVADFSKATLIKPAHLLSKFTFSFQIENSPISIPINTSQTETTFNFPPLTSNITHVPFPQYTPSTHTKSSSLKNTLPCQYMSWQVWFDNVLKVDPEIHIVNVPNLAKDTPIFWRFIDHQTMLSELGRWIPVLKQQHPEYTPLFDIQNLGSFDIIPGLYEGGFKLWQGSIYLLTFFSELVNTNKNPFPAWMRKQYPICRSIAGSRVLELGCGHGIPGIASLLLGAGHVTFQDLNLESLVQYTMTNTILNAPSWINKTPILTLSTPIIKDLFSLNLSSKEGKTLIEKTSFVACDWESFPTPLPQNKYDLILTSDTIYNESSIPTLLKCITSSLSPMGIALISCRQHYHGVGGGIIPLQKAVEQYAHTFGIRSLTQFEPNSFAPVHIMCLFRKNK